MGFRSVFKISNLIEICVLLSVDLTKINMV